jgi:adhesin transport system membrane fusion protein
MSSGSPAGRRAGDGIVEVPLPALALAGTGRGTRVLARMLALVALAVVLGIAFLPWQQSVQGAGRVIAFNPLDRRVSIEAPVNGRVKKLHVGENQRVRKGDLIVEIQDNDPNLIANLRSQHDAAISRRAAAQQRMDDLTTQVANQELAKPQAIDQAQQRINAEQYLFETNQLNFKRMQQLVTTGDVSQRDYELAKLAYDSSRANLAAAKASLERTAREFDAAISATKASRGTAEADRAAADREIAAIDSQISQSSQQVVEAPRDGIVMSVSATEGTFLKPGTPICVVIPETEERFVEAWVDGMDMPLITPRQQAPDGSVTRGSLVRLQFEGWPAVQFVGWPSVAVGTFGGEVISIDAADDGLGRFRIIIAPEQLQGDEAWPGTRFLRQGVRANAWVLLRQVPLWFELWRQLNGFPPVVADKAPEMKKANDEE